MRKQRAQTPNLGANAERTAILAKIRRMKKEYERIILLEELEDWILQRNERYNARKGGLK
jgi:hypothetical protein